MVNSSMYRRDDGVSLKEVLEDSGMATSSISMNLKSIMEDGNELDFKRYVEKMTVTLEDIFETFKNDKIKDEFW